VRSSLRVVVTGLIAQHPRMGGITWHYLQYVLGLKQLGHDVYYVEDSGEFPYNLDGGPSGTDWIATDCAENVSCLAGTMARFGLQDRWAYRFPLTSEWFGLPDAKRREILKSADLLLNVSGSLEWPEDYRAIPRVVYIDTDPVITHIKLAGGPSEFSARVEAHDRHFSFGESPSDLMPATRFRWEPTRQPIALSEWRPSTPRGDRFTTVMNWTSYEPLTWSGRTYGQKDLEFGRFLDLPARVPHARLELAISRLQYLKWPSSEAPSPVDGEPEPAARESPLSFLTRAGWRVVDSLTECADLESYRRYIESSKGEWSVAKNAYVVGRPGWFSERSACYLAAGRPVVVQDTGFAEVLPTGDGIVTFGNTQEAAEAIEAVETDYTRHAEAARAIAEAHFDAGSVLEHLIARSFAEDPASRTETRREIELHDREALAAAPVDSGPTSTEWESSGYAAVTLRNHIADHAAVSAWVGLGGARPLPRRIDVLKTGKKGAVYRLHGVGRGGAPVIAKRCRLEKAVIERTVYENVLPELPLPTLQYHGCFEESAQFWWLFLEDVGGERYSPSDVAQRAEAARWLGAMHLAGVRLPEDPRLPDRGPAVYLAHLRSARRAILELGATPRLEATERTTLLHILSLYDVLERQWPRLEAFCEPVPRTFVHGDCLAKNVHVRSGPDGPAVVPFDWGGAGWGLPATDLGQLALPYREIPSTQPNCRAFLESVQAAWPGFDVDMVEQLANLGQLFWSLKVIDRGVPELDHPDAHIASVVGKLAVYKSVLARTIRYATWKDGDETRGTGDQRLAQTATGDLSSAPA